MAENILYKIDKKRNRISDNLTGKFCDNSDEDNLWLCIKDSKEDKVDLGKGDYIHYSDDDKQINQDYVIEEAENDVYKLRKITD